MFERIIVPLDGTDFAESALAPARELARSFGSRLIVVRAEDLMGPEEPYQGADAADQQAQLERVGEVDAYLHDVVDGLRHSGYQADLILSLEDPASGIADAAQVSHADLAVMATHLRWNAALVRRFSTTLQVLARTRIPLLAWRAAPVAGTAGLVEGRAGSSLLIRPRSPILVPLDGSRFAECALDAAQALARALDTSLVLVRAVDMVMPPRGELDHAGQAPLLRALSAADTYVNQVRETLAEQGIAATTLSRVGSPLGVINGALREFDASLIVMGSHGQTGRLDSVLGSVAAQLVEEIDVPVLVTHPETRPDVC